MKEWNFRMHDTRKITARHIIETEGHAAASKKLMHSNQSITRKYYAGGSNRRFEYDDGTEALCRAAGLSEEQLESLA